MWRAAAFELVSCHTHPTLERRRRLQWQLRVFEEEALVSLSATVRGSEGSSGRSVGAISDVHERHAAASVWAVWYRSTSLLLQQLCMQRCRSDRERGRRRPARSDPQASARQQRQLRMQTPIQTESRRRPLQLRCADRCARERFPSAEDRTCTPRKNGRVSRQRQTQRFLASALSQRTLSSCAPAAGPAHCHTHLAFRDQAAAANVTMVVASRAEAVAGLATQWALTLLSGRHDCASAPTETAENWTQSWQPQPRHT